MSKTAEHTATPWSIRQIDRCLAAEIVGADNRRVVGDVLFDVPAPNHAETHANANLIVTAVNSHASNLRKVEALRDAVKLAQEFFYNPTKFNTLDVEQAYERALALAEEQAK